MRDTQGWNQYKIEKKLKKNVQGEQGVQEGRVQEPLRPPSVQVPPLRPNLGPYGFGPLSQSLDATRRKNERNYFSFSRPSILSLREETALTSPSQSQKEI